MRAAALPLALLAVAACAPRATIPDADRERAEADLVGKARFLRVACYVAPFFGDGGHALLSDAPLSEVHLLQTVDARTIDPPKAEKILPPGTPVRIKALEFPTAWIIARRIVTTPRYHPWVIVTVPRDDRPYVIVLPQTVASAEDVRAELERVLAPDDPTSFFEQLPPEQRAAILRKEPLEGMGARALEMAWGQPDRKRIDRPARTEEWSWTSGTRRAFLEDDHLVRFTR
jgi:hypothetical protein